MILYFFISSLQGYVMAEGNRIKTPIAVRKVGHIYRFSDLSKTSIYFRFSFLLVRRGRMDGGSYCYFEVNS